MKYISLLRGINVSGRNKIKMDDLRKLYESLGYGGVKTYIQSGNVVFTADKLDTEKTAAKISEEIEKKYGFTVPVVIRTRDELTNILIKSPFDTEKTGAEGNKYHITFLSGIPDKHAAEELQRFAADDETLVIYNREAYIHCPGSYGKSKLTNTLFEKKLGLQATTRNWKTILKLHELSE